MAKKTSTITVNNRQIAVVTDTNSNNYICLTDMIRANEPDADRTGMILQNWMRRKDTIEYIGFWEMLSNPKFNVLEFEYIKNEAGTNRFVMTAKEWVERTGAIGIISKAGRYGGTYAHKDIAYHFSMWLSPVFNLLVVKEVQRLEGEQSNPLLQQWDIKRILSKTNYTLHTDAIKNCIIPQVSIDKRRESVIYASEADLLNLALFGYTARDWQEANPELSGKYNMRDTATINQLVVLSNMESANSEMIRQGISRAERFEALHTMAAEQLQLLDRANVEHKFRKLLPGSDKPNNLETK